jgi:hypothetical protein
MIMGQPTPYLGKQIVNVAPIEPLSIKPSPSQMNEALLCTETNMPQMP